MNNKQILKRKSIKAGQVLLITVLLFFGPVSCVFFESCPDIKPYFSIQGLRTEHLRFTGQYESPWEAAGVSEPVKWDDYFMLVDFEKSYHAGSKGGASLYALSCDESGSSGTRDGIDTLYLVTLTDYNANYAQGDTLNDMLLANDWTSPPDGPLDFYPMAQYMEENRIYIRQAALGLKLAEPPKTAGEYHFKIVYVLNSGESFEAISKSVRLY